MRLQQRVPFITGGDQRLGYCIAQAFARKDAEVCKANRFSSYLARAFTGQSLVVSTGI
jgi:NAD(P)-dependent dehydrogenase (short-subunit alcohol dehydrogenase family)